MLINNKSIYIILPWFPKLPPLLVRHLPRRRQYAITTSPLVITIWLHWGCFSVTPAFQHHTLEMGQRIANWSTCSQSDSLWDSLCNSSPKGQQLTSLNQPPSSDLYCFPYDLCLPQGILWVPIPTPLHYTCNSPTITLHLTVKVKLEKKLPTSSHQARNEKFLPS